MGIEIHRTEHKRAFVILPHTITRDNSLSLCARGLLAYLLSLPPGWHVVTDQLARSMPESRTAIRRAMHELREAGYIELHTERGSDGRTRRHLEIADTKRGTSGAWRDQDKRAFPQVAPTAVIPAAGIPAVKNVRREPKYGEEDLGLPAPASQVASAIPSQTEDPTNGILGFPPQPTRVSGDVGEQPQHRNARTRAASRWASDQDIASQQAAESRARRLREAQGGTQWQATGTGTH